MRIDESSGSVKNDVLKEIFKFRRENDIQEKFNHSLPKKFGADAMVVGDTIYYKNSKSEVPMSLRIHETVHIMQYRKNGIPKFLLKYAGEYIGNLLGKKSRYDSYRHITFEEEAFKAEELFNKFVKGEID